MKHLRRKIKRRSFSRRAIATAPATARAPATSFLGPHHANGGRAASNDNGATDRRLDQFYTKEDVAAALYRVALQHIDTAHHRMVEPSAGTGSFLKLMPSGSLAYDVDPKYPGITTADFLTVAIDSHRPVAVIGNPPFGRNASLAVRFFNHAAWQAQVIAFIVPRSFRKGSVEDRLDRAFHRVHEEEVPADAFLFRGKAYDVPAVFQIWVRRSQPRAQRQGETSHPDFAFLKTADGADFAIRRVGAKAGQVHHEMTASPSSNYFIKGDIEATMRQLDFAGVVGNVAGNPSLAKSEIVALYRAHLLASGTEGIAGATRG